MRFYQPFVHSILFFIVMAIVIMKKCLFFVWHQLGQSFLLKEISARCISWLHYGSFSVLPNKRIDRPLLLLLFKKERNALTLLFIFYWGGIFERGSYACKENYDLNQVKTVLMFEP